MQIGILGATGPAGKGLAARFADAGHDVIAGSRDPARADAAVSALRERWDGRVAALRPGTNADAAKARDVVVIATTWDAAVETARRFAGDLAGKVVISVANGVEKADSEFRPRLPDEGSVAAAVQAAVPAARVVAAFQHVPASAFVALDRPLDGDVVVVGDDDTARDLVLDLAAAIPGVRALDGGSLANAVGLEAFGAVLLSINLRHRAKGALRILGVEGRPVSGAT